jgi:regulator of sigma E protease
MQQILYALLIVPILGVLVFVHELGHFLTARRVGIRVLEFGFGFPPRLFAIRRGGVDYSINLIFLGGFCKLLGENGDSSDPDSFPAKKPWQRILVLLAGSLMNVVLAIVIFIGLGLVGEPTHAGEVTITGVTQETPAQLAGLQNGDIILAIDGQRVETTAALHDATQATLGKTTTLQIRRGDSETQVSLVPRPNPPEGQGAMGIQITVENAHVVNVRHSLVDSVLLGFQRSAEVFVLVVYGIVATVQGAIAPDFAGPIGMSQLTAEVVTKTGGGWLAAVTLLQFTALLSINLCIINVLPLPALDGGRIVFVLIEALRGGRKIAPQKEGYIHFLGIMALFALMIFISYFDVLRLFSDRSFLP